VSRTGKSLRQEAYGEGVVRGCREKVLMGTRVLKFFNLFLIYLFVYLLVVLEIELRTSYLVGGSFLT
jgi:hypothetical protein